MKSTTLLFIFMVTILAGCAQTANPQEVNESWLEMSLTDIITQEEIRASDFEGEVLLVETFAVWCPTCKRQQQEVQQLDVAHITLNIDPNEDAELVREYIAQNGFSGHYAIAPQEYTRTLINEFSATIANAPSSPVILVCGDQQAQLLPRGLKSADDLRGHINEQCR